MSYTEIIKRDGRTVKFNSSKITKALTKAGDATGEFDNKIAKSLTLKVLALLDATDGTPTVEWVQDIVEEVLLNSPYRNTAKEYIIYRDQHSKLREIKTKANVDLIDQYLSQLDWQVNENSNMAFSLQGLNNYISSEVSKTYWLNKIYSKAIRDAHNSGAFHIHDLNLLSVYCVGWDLYDLLIQGFKGASGKIESRPPKHFRTALGQIVNFFYTLQGEAAGAQAFSNFDTLLAPFIRFDNLDYMQVKQALQEFVFNINVPTRTGFQCMSEDTEILGKDGWKKHNEVKVGDTIATFNTTTGCMEYLPVKKVFAREYSGSMYNLKNRISDQLISPKHRVVRKKFNSNEYVLEPIEDVIGLKSPFIVPVGSGGNVGGREDLNEDWVRLLAWIAADGSVDTHGRGVGRITIYQSECANKGKYDEIINICDSLDLKYKVREQKGLGQKCRAIRFDTGSSRYILQSMNTDKNKGVKFIPQCVLDSDTETSRIYIETYIKGDGHEGNKMTTTSELLKDQLQHVAANAGYGTTVLARTNKSPISKKLQYTIRLIRHEDTYINKVEEVQYEGIIWCPNTDNETVIARRNGKVFITGNTPFTNVTMDLQCSKNYYDQNVIIGGEIQEFKYCEFQKEMDILNTAFCEVMTEGDASGRVFTFPIPTYNITSDFDWDNPNLTGLWKMTAKYGIPYFSNFINSDMKPEDARSMCCRLRLDSRELNKRGGGLFGSNPLTGSVGVVTINLPRLGYTSTKDGVFDKDLMFSNLSNLLTLASSSLEIKRKVLERYTDANLYPYTKHYLSNIKGKLGEYWKNHFSTIGIVGMNELCLNTIGEDVGSENGRELALEICNFIREQLVDIQKRTGNNYNFEATPAEGTSYRLAKKDKESFPDIKTANDSGEPFYTNSTLLPVDYTDDPFEVLDLQDELQTKYTGGSVIHLYAGEQIHDAEVIKNLVRTVCSNYRLPYFSFSPTFSVCTDHGYLDGEQTACPKCGKETEVYSRVVGYLRPVAQWNKGKKEEYKMRKEYVIKENS